MKIRRYMANNMQEALLKVKMDLGNDDVILNTIGGILGYIIFRFGGKLVDKLPKFMKSQVFLDVLCLVIILFIIYLAFRFDFWRFLA